MTAALSTAAPGRVSPGTLREQLGRGEVAVIDVREPMEYAAGHIPGSRNIPLSRLSEADLPEGPLVLVCQSGNRSSRGVVELLRRGHSHPLADLEGGVPAWQQAGHPVGRQPGAPLPLMRQVQIAAGSLVLLGVILSVTVAPGWIWLAGVVGAGLSFAGLTGFCGLAGVLAALPWNRVPSEGP
jgi:rhodanese-related sulfurtransferase